MYEQIEKPKENKSKAIANSVGQEKSNGKQGYGFMDNRSLTVAQRKLQVLANHSKPNKIMVTPTSPTIQKQKAYDESNPLEDPRHFSATDIKAAIDACVANRSVIPGWLKDQVLGYLNDELLERDNDMQAHGGGDAGHIHYFGVIQDYKELVDNLTIDDDAALPVGVAPLQL